MKFVKFAMLLLSLVLSPSCSVRKMAISEVGSLIEDGIPAFERDDDLELMRDAIPANIKLLEVMLESSPDNVRLNMVLARLYASYSFGFLEVQLENPELQRSEKQKIQMRVNKFYQKGMKYGERAVVAYAETCRDKINVIKAFDMCLQEFSGEDMDVMFWYGFNLIAYLNRNLNSMEALSYGPKAEKIFQRMIKENEHYFYGMSHLFLMGYYGGRPEMMGGNKAKADEHYKKLKKIVGPSFLLADTFYARYISVQNEDEKEFEKLLQTVLSYDDSKLNLETYGLYNAIAKKMAKTYLDQKEDLF